MLIMLSDAAERLGSIPGAKPLPAKSPSRRRGHLLPGSCGYMRPLPPGPGMSKGSLHPGCRRVSFAAPAMQPCTERRSVQGQIFRPWPVSGQLPDRHHKAVLQSMPDADRIATIIVLQLQVKDVCCQDCCVLDSQPSVT